MTIKQNGGVFGRNPTLNDVTIEGTTIFDKDGSTVGSIGTISSDLYIAHDSTGTDSGLRFRNGIIQPCSATGGSNDASVSLGQASMRFSNLFVSSGVYFGTATSATHLDDYEEGTFTPTIIASVSNPTVTYSAQAGRYTKIGNRVHIDIYIATSAYTAGTGNFRISGLPFAVVSGSPEAGSPPMGSNVATGAEARIRADAGQTYCQMLSRSSTSITTGWGAAQSNVWGTTNPAIMAVSLTYVAG